ncbi:MAG: SLC13 family permease [Acidilobus sp.]
MTLLGAIVTIMVVVISIWLLFTRRLRHDLVGVISALVLIATGVVKPSVLLRDLSSTAVLVLASVMILAGLLSSSGFLDVIGDKIAMTIRNERVALLLILLMAALVSGFVSDVALTLTFVPVLYSMASRFRKPATRYLMALAYAAIIGGRYTMIGTSSNIVLESIWIQRFGHPIPLMSPARPGLVEIFLGVIVMVAAVPFITRQRGQAVARLEELGPREYLIEARVPDGSPLIGLSVRELQEKLGVSVRNTSPRYRRTFRRGEEVLGAGSELLVQVTKERLPVLLSEKGIEAKLTGKPLYELLVPGSSPLVGNTVYETNMKLGGVNLVGVSTTRRVTNLRSYSLSAGDVILVEGEEDDVARNAAAFNLIPIRGTPLKGLDRRLVISAALGMAIAIGGTLLGLNIALSFVAGAAASLVVSPSMLRRAYSFVDWPVIVFVGTYTVVGQALVASGLSSYMGVISSSPALLFLLSLALANLVGNVASAALLGPIAVSSPHPLVSVIAVAMGASSTFLTPFSHPSNLIAYSMGGYEAKDFLRAGAIVVAVITIITLLMVR